jgi:hypothetical protein
MARSGRGSAPRTPDLSAASSIHRVDGRTASALARLASALRRAGRFDVALALGARPSPAIDAARRGP